VREARVSVAQAHHHRHHHHSAGNTGTGGLTGFFSYGDMSLWRPVAPDGYVSLGDVAVKGSVPLAALAAACCLLPAANLAASCCVRWPQVLDAASLISCMRSPIIDAARSTGQLDDLERPGML